MPAARARAVRVAGAVLLAWLVTAAAAPHAAASAGWQRPVPGAVARDFDYTGDPFAAGRHRGVDFAARPGQPVRSACAGRVVFAGTAGSSGPTVSVRCGHWRVAYLPLRSIAVARGARVERGTRLGTAAVTGRHAGVHVGVRHEGRRWAHVDPMPFFGASAPQPPLAPAPRGNRGPPAPRARPVPRALPHRSPRALPRPSPRPAPPTTPLAPWPAWAGLALVLVGACGAATARRRRRAVGSPAAAEPRVSTSSA